MPINPTAQEVRDAAEAHRQFQSACARAFAGTRWKPYRYDAHNEVGTLFHTIVLKLTLRDLLVALPDAEIFPRSAKARDPRFTLRGEHPKRGRHKLKR
jgi:hypothetical protein